MLRSLQYIFISIALLFLVSCGGKDVGNYQGVAYPPTDKIATTFQHTQVPASCRVFAELFILHPTNATGKEIQSAVFKEAGLRGTDLILLGQSRQNEDDEGLQFLYFGPEVEYSTEKWNGWKFGFDYWEEQGEWVNIGLKEWGNQEVVFDVPVMMQAAFMRCR